MKTYLRYEHSVGTGVIASPRSASVLLHGAKSTVAVTPAYECAILWDLAKGEIRARYLPRKEIDGEVSCLCVTNDLVGEKQNGILVVGRTKGRVDLHDFKIAGNMSGGSRSQRPRVSLVGHSSAVTCASFNHDGSKLATGSLDTYIVIWDPITETGLFRLRGHKDEVTCLRFCSLPDGDLISSSKDTTMKLWDLDSQHCSKTIAEHVNGVWCFDTVITADRKRMFTGTSDGLIRAFDLAQTNNINVMPGSMNRQTSDRAETLVICDEILAIQSTGRVVEFYRIRTEDQASKKQKRRLRRLREKSKEITEEDETMWTQDELELACVLRTPHRARCVSMHKIAAASNDTESQYYVMITYTNNLVELYILSTTMGSGDDEGNDGEEHPKKKLKAKVKAVSTLDIKTRLELQGHRTDIRCVDLGDDDELALTAADGAIKLWNVTTGACLRTMKSGFSLCCAFSPNSQHSIVGTREGTLLVHNLNDGSLQKEIENAHDGQPIYSLDIHPDEHGMVTCGGDRTCKFWDFKQNKSTGFTLAHTRTLRLGDSGDAQCVRFTRGAKRADQLKVCVAMLDSTVKVFHEDSLEFALSLYGHKLPVLTMDSSEDGTLLATGSTDKTIKIWGLDFGDCHRSVFAHEGSVTCVRFVPKTHYLVSCGRDGRVRYWDVDANLERILTFDFAHYGDAWGLAISRDASFFLSVGKDKRVRRYNRTKDLVFIDEERAKEIEQKMEMEGDDDADATAAIPGAVDQKLEESLPVAKKTMQAVEVGDRLIEVLNKALHAGPEDEDEETRLERVGAQLARTARAATPQDLHDALVFLPYVHVMPMIIAFSFALKVRCEIETSAKAALTLVRIHSGRFVSVKDRDAVELLQKHIREALWEMRDLIGTNAAGLRAMERHATSGATSNTFEGF